MTVRTRNRSFQGKGGSVTYLGNTSTKAPVVYYQTTTDVVGEFGDENPFTSYCGQIKVPGVISGTSGSGVFKATYNNYPVSFAINGYSPALNALPGESFGDTNKAIADSHPSTPPVSIPNFLYELKDVPGMIRDAVSKAKALENVVEGTGHGTGWSSIPKYMENPKNPAQDWLNYNFGWKPLIGDLFALSNIAKYLEDRVKWINDPDPYKISRRREIGSFSTSNSVMNAAYDAHVGFYCNYTEYNVSRRWVVSHWRHDPIVSQALLQNNFTKALVAAGADAPISSVWNAIPFTWLTDWFVDVGSIITIRENRSGISFLNASVMTNRKRTLVLHPLKGSSPLRLNTMVCEAEQKQRVPAAPTTPTVGGTNIFQPNHLATLASLKVTRGSRAAF